MPGAIVIAVPSQNEDTPGPASPGAKRPRFLAGIEVLGRSVLSRMVQDLSQTKIHEMSILVDSSLISSTPDSAQDLSPYAAPDVWGRAKEKLLQARENGIDTVLVMLVRAYLEFDPADLIQFHRDRGEAVTRGCDERGALDLWAVNPRLVNAHDDLLAILRQADRPYYPVRGYVNHLHTLRDLRSLCVDGLMSRCKLRPKGYEVRPGVWMAEGAQVDRAARIVAPAYIGSGARVAEQCLVTRCSSIESNSQVDYGTVVEDSWVLPNTYVGIGLDLAHSIASGSSLWNLNRDVRLEIVDPVVMRQQQLSKSRRHVSRPWRSETRVGEMALSVADDSTR